MERLQTPEQAARWLRGRVTGSLWTDVTATAAPDLTTTCVVLLATSALVTLAAAMIFRVSERRARDRGLLDRTTGS